MKKAHLATLRKKTIIKQMPSILSSPSRFITYFRYGMSSLFGSLKQKVYEDNIKAILNEVVTDLAASRIGKLIACGDNLIELERLERHINSVQH